MMTFIPIAASVISFIEVPQRNEVCSWNATVWRIYLLCRREGLCAVAGFFLIYALSLRLLCSMNKIKKKKKKIIVGYFGEMQRDYITLLDKQSKEIWKLQIELGE